MERDASSSSSIITENFFMIRASSEKDVLMEIPFCIIFILICQNYQKVLVLLCFTKKKKIVSCFKREDLIESNCKF